MRKSLVKLDLASMTVPQKIEKTRQIVIKMTGNANFATPDPTLVAVTTAATDLETAYTNALDGGVELTAIKDEMEAILDNLLSNLAAYVQNQSDFSETIIRSAGMDVRNAPAPVGIPKQVAGLIALFSVQTGTIRLRWKRTRGAYVYHVYMTEDVTAPLSWKLIGTVTQTRFVEPGLDTGKRYWFKVEAIGSAGAGAASDPATMIAA